jgi:hypothetical protein
VLTYDCAGDTFQVPPGLYYGLTNNSKQYNVKLYYTLIDQDQPASNSSSTQPVVPVPASVPTLSHINNINNSNNSNNSSSINSSSSSDSNILTSQVRCYLHYTDSHYTQHTSTRTHMQYSCVNAETTSYSAYAIAHMRVHTHTYMLMHCSCTEARQRARETEVYRCQP